MADKNYNGIYYDSNNKPYIFDPNGNKAYMLKESAKLNKDGYYFEVEYSTNVLKQDKKAAWGKQMSIDDLKQQEDAEKNKELQEQQRREAKEAAKAAAEKEALEQLNVEVLAKSMSRFKLTLDKLKNKFCNNRVIYTMYFKMTLNNNSEILVDTLSSDWDENCLVSFKYEMNGSGEANQFTLDLLYKPNDRSISSIKTLESKLLSNVGVTTDKEGKNLKNIDALYNNCSFQYGYGDDVSLRSPMYNGMITDYDCKIDNGNLRYTISGIGGLTSMKETRISAKDEYLKGSDGSEINNPLLYIENIIRIELENNGLYTLKILDNVDKENVTTIGDDYKQFSQKNIFQVINDILAQCITKDQQDVLTGDKRILPSQKQMFGYYVDDTTTTVDNKTYNGTIYIYKLPAANGPENKENVTSPKADLGITFNWFGSRLGDDANTYSGLVKNWNPKFEGSALFGLAVNLLSHDGSTSYYTMDEEGTIIQVQGLGAAREGTLGTGDKGIASTIQEYSNWAFLTQYPYSATMTTIGCPCEVPMIGKIAINALMGSEIHHSSGIYYVLKKTDTINNSGFWSDFELFKIVVTYDPEYSEIKNIETTEEDPKAENNNEKQKELDIIEQGHGPKNPDNFYYDENGQLVEKDKNVFNIFDTKLFTPEDHGGRGGTY